MKITKVAKNNVEVVYTKEVKDTSGKTVQILDEDTKKSYGQAVVEDERVQLEAQLIEIEAYDKVAETAKVQEQLDILDNIEAKLNEEMV